MIDIFYSFIHIEKIIFLLIFTACKRCRSRGASCNYKDALRLAVPLPQPGQGLRNTSPEPNHTHDPTRNLSSAAFIRPVESVLPSPPNPSPSLEESHHIPSGCESSPGPSAVNKDQHSHSICYTGHGTFAKDVVNTILKKDSQFWGTTTAATPTKRIPFVNAPLFGEADLDLSSKSHSHVSLLPPRSHADRLVDIYWRYVDSIEPVLDAAIFHVSYNKAYSARPAQLTTSSANSDTWLSIVNLVFALAVQVQEAIPSETRNGEANLYFQRAWSLFHPETVLWKTASIEIIQCLMLMNRYLHCTNNQERSWMTAGLALRMAENICFHSRQTASSLDGRLYENVWASCVAMDR